MFGPNKNNIGPISFDEACRNATNVKPKRKKVKQVVGLGKRVNFCLNTMFLPYLERKEERKGKLFQALCRRSIIEAGSRRFS